MRVPLSGWVRSAGRNFEFKARLKRALSIGVNNLSRGFDTEPLGCLRTHCGAQVCAEDHLKGRLHGKADSCAKRASKLRRFKLQKRKGLV